MRSLLGDLTRMLDSWPDHPEWNHRTHVRNDVIEFEYRRVRRVFCRLEPKLIVKDPVVLVSLRGATAAELQPAGDVIRRTNTTYVVVRTRRGAKALAPLIQRAWLLAFDKFSSVMESTGRPMPVAPWQQ